MIVKSIWLRKIHKWIGLVIGLQFLVWTISGSAMALISMDEVAGGKMAEQPSARLPSTATGWPIIQRHLGNQPIRTLSLRSLPGRQAIEVATARGLQLFDSQTGEQIEIEAATAAAIASAAHPAGVRPSRVTRLGNLGFAVREHQLPIWRVDFADQKNSSYYVSGVTGELLERRNDSWRWWDFFWMLHNMDYANRTSFNHPLIIIVGVSMAWLAITGFWLLFRTMWRHDFARLKRVGRTPAGDSFS